MSFEAGCLGASRARRKRVPTGRAHVLWVVELSAKRRYQSGFPPLAEDAALSSPTDAFVPAPDGALWQTIAPAKAGFDAEKLKAAVDFAREQESPWPRSLYYPDGSYVGNVEWNERGPWTEIVGPVRERIVGAVAELLTDANAYRAMARGVSPYGDGHAAGRIVDVLRGALR